MNLDRVTSGRDVPDDFNVVVEIPMNADPIKYEVDKESGAIFVGMTKSPKTPVYSLIERSYGVRITKVQQDIHGTLIAGASAAALNVSDGAAGLFIILRYYIDAELVEVTTGLHPADRFVYSMAFQLATK